MHQIERMRGLPRRPLHQIVERAEHHDPVGVGIALESHVAEVGPGKDLRVRVAMDAALSFHDANEGLRSVGGSVDLPQRPVVEPVAGEHMAGREHAAHHLDRGSGKVDIVRTKGLRDLAEMAVSGGV